eukprot:Rhum_TRINITY_DN25059_c0_g1::Rhum_TRINITY_DN25059_c0_g1_i1::g.181051::m.181051
MGKNATRRRQRRGETGRKNRRPHLYIGIRVRGSCDGSDEKSAAQHACDAVRLVHGDSSVGEVHVVAGSPRHVVLKASPEWASKIWASATLYCPPTRQHLDVYSVTALPSVLACA